MRYYVFKLVDAEHDESVDPPLGPTFRIVVGPEDEGCWEAENQAELDALLHERNVKGILASVEYEKGGIFRVPTYQR